jgi:hypothetical protein
MKRRARAILIMFVLAGIVSAAIPSYRQAREESLLNRCQDNLRQIDAAIDSCAVTYQWQPGGKIDDPVNIRRIIEHIKGIKMPICPSGGKYSIPVLGKNPSCSVHGELIITSDFKRKWESTEDFMKRRNQVQPTSSGDRLKAPSEK